MNLFSLVTNEIFSYRSMLTVNQIVAEKVKDMELYLYKINGVRKNKSIDFEMIKHTLHHLEESIKSSTRYYFVENEFFRDLPPNMKIKLVFKVLEQQHECFRFFFKDYMYNWKVPDPFIALVLINLDSTLYLPGDAIIKEN